MMEEGTRVLKAKPAADSLTEKMRQKTQELKDRGIVPTLAIVRVGEREDDLAYERGIIKRFEKADARVVVHALPESATDEEASELLRQLDGDSAVHGVLMFRPLPAHLSEDRLKNLISPEKDVDCMSDLNLAHVFAQDKKGYPPCTPKAVIEMLHYYDIPLKGKKVTVVGRSLVVGKPLAMLLLAENATVTICHTRTEDLAGECKRADIICAAAGSARMIGEDFVRSGQVVMDVGINVVDGELCGDVDYEKAAPLVDAITPVPGGVGGMTTAVLLSHVVDSASQSSLLS